MRKASRYMGASGCLWLISLLKYCAEDCLEPPADLDLELTGAYKGRLSAIKDEAGHRHGLSVS
jgi:hypothetical protein